MTLAEAAERHGRNAEYLRVAVNRGVLKAEKIGKTWVVSEVEFARYLASNPKRGRPATSPITENPTAVQEEK